MFILSIESKKLKAVFRLACQTAFINEVVHYCICINSVLYQFFRWKFICQEKEEEGMFIGYFLRSCLFGDTHHTPFVDCILTVYGRLNVVYPFDIGLTFSCTLIPGQRDGQNVVQIHFCTRTCKWPVHAPQDDNNNRGREREGIIFAIYRSFPNLHPQIIFRPFLSFLISSEEMIQER